MTTNINQVLRANPRCSKYGAPMGAPNVMDRPNQAMHLQAVARVSYDYTPDGTYWGNGGKEGWLYCAFTPCLSNKIFVRAHDRREAMLKVVDGFPLARFKVRT